MTAVLAFLFFLIPKICFADENNGIYINDGIYISEVMWAGSSASATYDKWIELYNNSEDIVDLSGWEIIDDTNNPKNLIAKIPDGKMIAPKEYFLIAHYSKDSGKSVLKVDPDVVDSRVNWSKNDLQILLKDPSRDPLQQTIDTAGNGDGFSKRYGNFYANNKELFSSLQRINYSKSQTIDDWAACLRSSDFDKVSDPVLQKYFVIMDPKNIDLACATPKTSSKMVYNLSLITERVKIGENENLVFSYNFSDQANEFNSLTVTISDSLKQNFIEKNSSVGQKEFVFSQSACYPNVKISFYDQNGLWFERSFSVVCYQLSSQIKFYEVLPHPKNVDWNKDGVNSTDDEWIELVNFGPAEVSLDGWKISDASGKEYQIGKNNIGSEDFYAIYKSQSGIALNDSGETLFLYDPLGRLMDTIKIPSSSSKYDQSYAKWGDKWYWTATPTPSKVNEILDPSSQSAESYDELTDAQGKKVELQGEVRDSERTGFTVIVDSKPVFVEISDQNMNVPIGTRLTVLGRARSGNPPYIVSSYSDIKIGPQSQSDNASHATKSSDILSASIVKGTTIIKTIKTKKTKRLKFEANKMSPIVLGASTKRLTDSFNFSYILLCFSGILSFFGIILIYDFCCRK